MQKYIRQHILTIFKQTANSTPHQNAARFKDLALEAFHFQAEHCEVYKNYIQLLGVDKQSVKNLNDIPFIPIELFKIKKIITGNFQPQLFFESSGTTSQIKSRHYIADDNLYKNSCIKGFKFFYDNFKNTCFLALLPSYLERKNASIVQMVKYFIQESGNKSGGFFLNNYQELLNRLQNNSNTKTQILLFGVSFALIEFVKKYEKELSQLNFKKLIVMETGGMKGKQKEITRNELHKVLQNGFGIRTIHSEYGMTELLSQAYSKGNGIFQCPPWMKILIRDVNDPFEILKKGKTGGINIIDLANIYSCCFIATSDLGKLLPGGSFEVLGRFDHSDIRGCNLMIALG